MWFSIFLPSLVILRTQSHKKNDVMVQHMESGARSSRLPGSATS